MSTAPQQQASMLASIIMQTVNKAGYASQRFPFIGLISSLILFGITSVLFFFYIIRSGHTKYESYGLAICMLHVIVQIGGSVESMYHILVQNYALPNAMMRIGWVFMADPILLGNVNAFVSSVYANRLFVLVGGKMWVKIAAYSAIAIKYGVTITNTVALVKMPQITLDFMDPGVPAQAAAQLAHLEHWRPVFAADNFLYVPIDLSICVATVLLLSRERKNSPFAKTTTLLNHIMLMILCSLILPTIAYFVAGILTLFSHNSPLILTASLPLLSLISCIGMLNERDEVKAKWDETRAAGISVNTQALREIYTEPPSIPGYNRRPFDGSQGTTAGGATLAHQSSSDFNGSNVSKEKLHDFLTEHKEIESVGNSSGSEIDVEKGA